MQQLKIENYPNGVSNQPLELISKKLGILSLRKLRQRLIAVKYLERPLEFLLNRSFCYVSNVIYSYLAMKCGSTLELFCFPGDRDDYMVKYQQKL